MITAVDTNILFDILLPDESHVLNSKRLLDEHASKGQLIICEIVYAELASQFGSEKETNSFLSDTGIRLVNSSEESLAVAGEHWRAYLKNRKPFTCPKCNHPVPFRQRVLSDFIIGAHALTHAEQLLSRDRGFYKIYFKDLKVRG
jgi:predicted nucleic acid-binding protein